MQFKKAMGKIFGVQLNKAEQKAMDAEINRQILEHDDLFCMDNDATVLWTLHVCFGFGEKRLKSFGNVASKSIKDCVISMNLNPKMMVGYTE